MRQRDTDAMWSAGRPYRPQLPGTPLRGVGSETALRRVHTTAVVRSFPCHWQFHRFRPVLYANPKCRTFPARRLPVGKAFTSFLASEISVAIHNAQAPARDLNPIPAKFAVGAGVCRIVTNQIVRAVFTHDASKTGIKAVAVQDGKASTLFGKVARRIKWTTHDGS